MNPVNVALTAINETLEIHGESIKILHEIIRSLAVRVTKLEEVKGDG